jgi:DNA repair exonuclease SbcCD nuclease subunit
LKIIHFSDTHLGYNDLDILNENNINQREADFYDAFCQVVDQIKQIKPDYIIHTGDLFHRSSPSNRAISFALEQFKIINDLNIPFILIAGNHSTPRTNLSTPILKIFDNFENIYTSYKQEYKKIEFNDIIFHTLPHMNDETKAISQIELCEENINNQKKNIMMMHCSVGATYLMQEFGEWVYPKQKEYIFNKMDYVALGHWHGFSNVTKYKNVYYSGSLERTSLNDKRESKGFILLDLNNKINIEYIKINIRKILSFVVDCSDFENSINSLKLEDIKDNIIDLKLSNLTPTQSINIQNHDIKEIFKTALYINIKREFISNDDNDNSINNIESISLQEYFLQHIKQDESIKNYDSVKIKIQELFNIYEQAHNDTE